MTTIARDGRSDVQRAFRAEWTKLRTEPGTAWILTAICLLTVAVGAGTAALSSAAVCCRSNASVAPSGSCSSSVPAELAASAMSANSRYKPD